MSNLALSTTSTASSPVRIPASRPRKVNHLTAVAPKVEARGFALYIGVTEAEAAQHGITLRQLSAELRKTLETLVPSAESHAVVALAPENIGGSNIEVVRTALQDPARQNNLKAEKAATENKPSGVVIDTTRRQVLLDGEASAFSYREFELLKYFVLREGQTIAREDLINDLWPGAESDSDRPNGRTIDVHIRRLRVKLGRYEDIVQTVRGLGYRFDFHADVRVIAPAGPSPDRF